MSRQQTLSCFGFENQNPNKVTIKEKIVKKPSKVLVNNKDIYECDDKRMNCLGKMEH